MHLYIVINDLLFIGSSRISRYKVQGDRIDTVALACLGRTIIKYMPEVATASPAHDLSSDHTKAVIGMGGNLTSLDLAIEARPSAV